MAVLIFTLVHIFGGLGQEPLEPLCPQIKITARRERATSNPQGVWGDLNSAVCRAFCGSLQPHLCPLRGRA